MVLRASMERLQVRDIQTLLRDFRGLDPNDPGQWPLVPRVVALVAIFLVIVVGGPASEGCTAWDAGVFARRAAGLAITG